MAAKKCLLLCVSFHELPLNKNFSRYRLNRGSENSAAKAKATDSGSRSAVDQFALDKLRSDLKESKEKYDELLKKYKRALADSENMRERLEKRAAEAKIFGIKSFGKDLLEVVANLQNVLAAVPKTELEKNKELKNLYDGLTMTLASLLQILKRHGLEPMQRSLHTKRIGWRFGNSVIGFIKQKIQN